MNRDGREPLRFDYVWAIAMLFVLLAAWPTWLWWRTKRHWDARRKRRMNRWRAMSGDCGWRLVDRCRRIR